MDDTFTNKQKTTYKTMLFLSAVFIGFIFLSIIESYKYMKIAIYLLPIWLTFGCWIYKNIPSKLSVIILTSYIYMMSVLSLIIILYVLDGHCSPFPKDKVRPVCMFLTSIERYLLIFNPVYFIPCLFYASIVGLLIVFSNAKTKINHSGHMTFMLLLIIFITIFPAIFNIKF